MSSPKAKTTLKPKIPKTRVFVILDKSASMASVREETVKGLNSYFKDLNDQRPRPDVDLTLFDTKIYHRGLMHLENDRLSLADYEPDGWTALYDAICTTLESSAKEVAKDQKAIVVIMTDGEENSSKKYDLKQFISMKEELEAKGNWSFVFMGANQDAWATAGQWGFSPQNVASFNATSAGIGAVFSNLSAATMNYTHSDQLSTKSMFSKEQQQNMKDTE